MLDDDAGRPNKTTDRKLGDQWADRDGRADTIDLKIEANPSLFFILAAVNVLIFVFILSAGLYMIKLKIEQFDPVAMDLIERSVVIAEIGFFILASIEGISLFKFRRSVTPYKLLEKLVLWLLPREVWMGSKFGISRDRVGNSFIKLNNLITKSYLDRFKADRLVGLLPRCLKREARSNIISKLEGKVFKILTVSGGEEAREAITQCRPTLILAFACERDLMSGTKDVAEKVPVRAIPNKRPEGPCKNPDIPIAELADAMAFVAERGKLN